MDKARIVSLLRDTQLTEDDKIEIFQELLNGLSSQSLARLSNQVSTLIKRDFISLLPIEISISILSYTNHSTVCICSKVCKKWYKISLDFQIWKSLFYNQNWDISDTFINTFYSHDATMHQRSGLKKIEPHGYGSLPRINSFKDAKLVTLDDYNDLNWKHIYSQRHLIENRWSKGKYVAKEIVGHSEAVYCVQFDSQKIITGSMDNTIRIWNFTGRCLATLHGHLGSVLCLQFRGNTLLSGSSDTTMIKWNLSSGLKIWKIKAHDESVLSLVFNDKIICSCSKDKNIKIWDLEGRLLRVLEGHDASVNALQLTDTMIISASGDRTIRTWDLKTGNLINIFKGHTRGIACIKVLGDTLVSGSSDHSIKIWDVNTGTLRNTLQGHFDLVRTIDFSQKFIISGSYDETVKIWDSKTGQLLHTFREHISRVFKVQQSTCKLVSCSQDKRIIVWDFAKDLDARFFD